MPVILAGGVGSRLWPMSRELFPKQFHRLLDEHSLLQATLARARAVTDEAPILLCNDEHRFLVAEQCREIGQDWRAIVLEPEARGTAPAIALAAQLLAREAPDAIMLVLPSDHLVPDLSAFRNSAMAAAEAASAGGLTTFGVQPTRAETGYGYIRIDPDVAASAASAATVLPVHAFVEKPQAEQAAEYVAAGNYLWNSGMFVFGASTYLEELRACAPAIDRAVAAAVDAGQLDLDFFRPGEAFGDSPSVSIDYAVMEKTAHAKVVPAQFEWHDIGSWSALWGVTECDAQGNSLLGDVQAVDTRDTYVRAEDRLVATLGVDNLVVVETSDAVLVAQRDRLQDVREVVERLKQQERSEFHSHKRIWRPWGSFEAVGDGRQYQVKRIKVKPGASLSLQKHEHRAEHWIVVNGTADVICGERRFTLGENESTYIPVGVTHRLANPGEQTLELIEVQVGDYLGEDDIVRYTDDYGRSGG